MRAILVALILALVPPMAAAQAVVPSVAFTAITGEALPLDAWRGRPVLVVNTASLCGFAPQLRDLQRLHERYSARGLVVLAVPSDDFNQELPTNAAVEDFCRLELGPEVALAQITPILGAQAHPFYGWLAEAHGIVSAWNFTKALIGPDGRLLGVWGASTRPTARSITSRIETALGA